MNSVTYNQDCLEAMRAMDDNQFSLAVVDPPYGIGADAIGVKKFGAVNGCIQRNGAVLGVASVDYPQKSWDTPPCAEYFSELRRVSCNQIIWGGNYFVLPTSSAWLVWNKCNIGTDQSDAELAWTSFPTAVRMFSFMWSGMMQGSPENGEKMQGNKRLNEKRIHPTQKPVALYKWLLTNYAKPGQTILDTHLGSGSSRIAAYDLGFDFTGYELDKDYFDAQEERFKNHTAQAKLFEPEPIIETQDSLFA